MLIATESCSVLNLFYRQIIHRNFAIPKGGFFHLSIPYFLGKKINSGLSLHVMFVLYMEALYIFLKIIEILVIISHLHLLLTYLCITYMVKSFCLWKTLGLDESFFTGQPFLWVVFFIVVFLGDWYHHPQPQKKYCCYQIDTVQWI